MSSSGYTEPGSGASANLEDQNHDMELAQRIADIFNDIPTLSEQEVADRHRAESLSTFDDENYHVELFRDEYRPDEMMIPGFGDVYDGSDGNVPCGEAIPHVGDKCGHRADVGRTCGRSMCPRCGAAWVAKRATNIVKNIWGAAKMKDGSQKLHHVVLSPPPGMMVDSTDWYESCMARISDWMEEIDMDGIVLPHPYSGDHEGTFAENHQDDRGEWKKRLFSGRNWHGDVREELKHRPHFHVIGAAEWVPGGDVTDAVYNRTKPSENAEHGWVTKRITQRNGSPISLGSIQNLARAVTYSLSHCVIDTTGEKNQYLHKKRGSAYHANDRHEGKARKAIHDVIGDTLGIDWTDVGCYGRTPADDADAPTSVATTAEDDRDLDTTAADEDGLEGEATAETDGLTSCHCSLTAVHKADFVDDPEWQQQAFHSEEAVEAREEWEEVGGFDRWIDEDDPPPD